MEMRRQNTEETEKKTDNDTIDKSKNINYCIKHKWFYTSSKMSNWI